jgi:hypothetical protein
MKQNKTPNGGKVSCKEVQCFACDLCNATNFEERRTARTETKTEIKALYGAEALTYSFYFSPGAARSYK